MDDPQGMGVFECVGEVDRHRQRVGDRHPSVGGLGDPVRQRPAAHVLRDDEVRAALGADVDDRDDVWMIAQPSHDLGFAVEPVPARVIEIRARHDGQGDVAIETGVGSEPYFLASAGAQQLTSDVATVADRLGHRRACGDRSLDRRTAARTEPSLCACLLTALPTGHVLHPRQGK